VAPAGISTNEAVALTTGALANLAKQNNDLTSAQVSTPFTLSLTQTAGELVDPALLQNTQANLADLLNLLQNTQNNLLQLLNPQ
jgi:hypothetical protein